MAHNIFRSHPNIHPSCIKPWPLHPSFHLVQRDVVLSISLPPPPLLLQVLALFTKWNAALLTKDPKKVAALYAPYAVLLPTVSNIPRNTPALIEDYFVTFLKLQPSGTINKYFIEYPAANTIINSGIYTFKVRGCTVDCEDIVCMHVLSQLLRPTAPCIILHQPLLCLCMRRSLAACNTECTSKQVTVAQDPINIFKQTLQHHAYAGTPSLAMM